MINFLQLRIPSLISKDQKENIICTMDDGREDFLGPPHGTTPAAVISNKNKSEILYNRANTSLAIHNSKSVVKAKKLTVHDSHPGAI